MRWSPDRHPSWRTWIRSFHLSKHNIAITDFSIDNFDQTLINKTIKLIFTINDNGIRTTDQAFVQNRSDLLARKKVASDQYLTLSKRMLDQIQQKTEIALFAIPEYNSYILSLEINSKLAASNNFKIKILPAYFLELHILLRLSTITPQNPNHAFSHHHRPQKRQHTKPAQSIVLP